MSNDFFETDSSEAEIDPDATPLKAKKVTTQPYDLIVQTLIDQIQAERINLRPTFQRGYVWPKDRASKLIESIILNVPIPPCYLSQAPDFKLDVIDGQQRLTSILKYINNEYALSGLNVFHQYNGLRFFQLPATTQRQIESHTIRCVVITNESDDEIKFDVFERLNTNNIPLNAQELRNCIYRGPLNDLLKELASEEKWLQILKRKSPDKRMKGEETILRFFSFHIQGVEKYRTPLKNWLSTTASIGSTLDPHQVESLRAVWERTLCNCLTWFPPHECFRKPGQSAINRGLFDLVTYTASQFSTEKATAVRPDFLNRFNNLLKNEEYIDIVSRSVDHKKRTVRRFEIWNETMAGL